MSTVGNDLRLMRSLRVMSQQSHNSHMNAPSIRPSIIDALILLILVSLLSFRGYL